MAFIGSASERSRLCRRPRRRLHNKAFPIKRTSTYLSRSAQIILLSFCTIATPEVASSSFLLLKTCYIMRLLATVPLGNHRGNSIIVWPLRALHCNIPFDLSRSNTALDSQQPASSHFELPIAAYSRCCEPRRS